MTTTQHVPRAWHDAFVLALRERDVSGADIGDALAHVESYCTDSGEDADEAFGPARTYAATLPLPSGSPEPAPWAPTDGRGLGRYVAGMLAIAVLGTSVGAWTRGEPVRLGAAELAPALVALVSLALLVRNLGTVLRWCTTRRWVAVVVLQLPLLCGIGLALLTGRLLPGTGATVPAAPLALAAAVTLVAPALAAQLRGATDDADVLAGPLEDPASVRRRANRANTLLTWMLPLCGLACVAVTLGLGLLPTR